MPSSNEIVLLRFPDLTPWQWSLFSPIADALTRRCSVEVVDADQVPRRALRALVETRRAWVLSPDWRTAVRRLAPTAGARLHVSVLEMTVPHRALATLFVKHLIGSLPAGVRFLAYSPLNFRFLCEMERLHSERVTLLPLVAPAPPPRRPREPGQAPIIGTFAPFVAESNLHHFLTVAHYVCRRHPTVQFRLMGAGPLYGHLRAIARDLELGGRVSVLHANDAAAVADLDVFVYLPLRNDHFAPVFAAAAASVPVLASEVPGLEELLTDGADSFVFPVHETKPMAEVCLRLLNTPSLSQYLAGRLAATLARRFPVETVADRYESLFFGGERTADFVPAVA